MFFSKSGLKAVLFDMDGTIIDSEPYWLKSEQALAAEHAAEWTEQDGQRVIGLSLTESSKLIKEHIGSELEIDEIVQRLSNSVNSQLAKEIPWRPGAQELIRELRRKNIKTALVTMSLRKTALQVVEAIPFKAFDVVIAGDDVVHGKPHAEPYLKAATALGFAPSECIAFEDSITGILSAEAAGTVAIGIPNMMIIPTRPARNLWPTLEGVTVKQLKAFHAEISNRRKQEQDD
jgi:HAD superfamily hydrolase (TIGR01509 family)